MEEQATPSEQQEPEKAPEAEKQELAEEEIVWAPQRKQVSDLLGKLIDILKRFNGYKCVSVCRLTKFNDDPKQERGITSGLARRIFVGYIMTGRGSKEEFMKNFVGAPIAYVQVHKEIPVMAEDGCYDELDVNGKPNKTISAAEYMLVEPEKFEPYILIRQGPDKVAMIKGNPYRKITKEEAQAVVEKLQGPSEEDQS
jgi:hypothetical protein